MSYRWYTRFANGNNGQQGGQKNHTFARPRMNPRAKVLLGDCTWHVGHLTGHRVALPESDRIEPGWNTGEGCLSEGVRLVAGPYSDRQTLRRTSRGLPTAKGR